MEDPSIRTAGPRAAPREIDVFWFMLIALVAVVAAVALAVLGDGGALKDAEPDRIEDRLPPDRPLVAADIEAVRLPVGLRGYRMLDVDEVLERLAAELGERDARIADLEANLAGAHAGARLYRPAGEAVDAGPGAQGRGYDPGQGYGRRPAGGYAGPAGPYGGPAGPGGPGGTGTGPEPAPGPDDIAGGRGE
jgi:DivIVA domain-containing protein